MASTNKTTNLKLSQYINSDRPSYLQDYNEDMRKIDEFANSVKVKDTGWKILVHDSSGNLTCYRRINNTVYFVYKKYSTLDTPSNAVNLGPIPKGFKPSNIYFTPTTFTTSFNGVYGFMTGSNALYYLHAEGVDSDLVLRINQTISNIKVNICTSWVTDDEFPED